MGICYLFLWEHQALVVNDGKTQIKVCLSLGFSTKCKIYFKLSKAESDALY